MYTAYTNGKGGYEIPFLICRGLSFIFTMILMIGMSLAGPKINEKVFELDKAIFKMKPQTTILVVLLVLTVFALHVKFW